MTSEAARGSEPRETNIVSLAIGFNSLPARVSPVETNGSPNFETTGTGCFRRDKRVLPDMSSVSPAIADSLEPLGTAVGAFLVLVGLGTVLGMPWATNNSIATSAAQLLGVVLTIAIGAGLIWFARNAE